MSYLASDTAMIIPAAEHYPRNWDSEYYYDQDADFYYLTGFNEPQALLLLLPDRPNSKTVLFCRASNPQEELWLGKRAGLKGAESDYAINTAYDIADLDELLAKLLKDKKKIYYPVGKYDYLDALLLSCVRSSRKGVRRGQSPVEELCESRTLIRQMRAVKSEEELQCMRKAMAISVAAHVALMKQCRADMFEYELEALFAYKCRSAGADALLAYDSIVGSGENACTLHYHENASQMKDGELVLVDAGCRFDHYTSDITRTYPVNGQFTDHQRQFYEVVLKAQQ